MNKYNFKKLFSFFFSLSLSLSLLGRGRSSLSLVIIVRTVILDCVDVVLALVQQERSRRRRRWREKEEKEERNRVLLYISTHQSLSVARALWFFFNARLSWTSLENDDATRMNELARVILLHLLLCLQMDSGKANSDLVQVRDAIDKWQIGLMNRFELESDVRRNRFRSLLSVAEAPRWGLDNLSA